MNVSEVGAVTQEAFKQSVRSHMAAILGGEVYPVAMHYRELFDSFYIFPWGITLTFKDGLDPVTQRETVVDIMRRLKLESGRKQKPWIDSPSLSITFTSPPFTNDCPFIIEGYKPPTCRMVKHTRVIAARPAQEERVEEYESIMCEKENEAEELPLPGLADSEAPF